MVARLLKSILISLTVALCFYFVSCSGSDRSSVSSSFNPTSSVLNYFPLVEGTINEFTINEPNGSASVVTMEVGPIVPFGSKSAHEWRVVDGTGASSTSLVMSSSSAIVFYETTASAGETILALPLAVGSSWDRFGFDPVNEGNTFGGLITGGNSKGDSDPPDTTAGGKTGDGSSHDAGKNFPTDGSSQLSIEKFETVVLSNGSAFANSVKLVNGGLGGVNAYWFAPGVGLVRYALRAGADGSEDGATIGELRRVLSR